MILDTEIKKNIEKELDANPECFIGVLNGRRIFSAIRNGRTEILILLSSYCIDEFLHLAFINGKWFTSLLSVSGYVAGNSDAEIINDFWENIARIGYDLPFISDTSIDCLEADNLDGAMSNLIKIIQSYKESEWYQKGFAVFDVYGSEPIISGPSDTRRLKRKWS